MTSCILAGFPQTVWADAPTYDPIFYYYHTDHLGSSMVMTNRDGELVQHYGYTAFGYERYKHNSSAFSITNRYTGQQLDEDTGLYFYNSRYYDPQLARFTQADTIVPSANTSQALNRYSYVKNNPLKFTDPSGHGWFKKIWKRYIKPYIGAIVQVALIASGWGIVLSAFVGSLVSFAVNGGTFKSFAVGVGIGIAAGYIAGGVGDGLFGEAFSASLNAGTATLATKAMFSAMAGAAGGAISSAVYGQNIEKGLKYGAIGGLTGMAVAVATSAAISFGKSVIGELVPQSGTDPNGPTDPNNGNITQCDSMDKAAAAALAKARTSTDNSNSDPTLHKEYGGVIYEQNGKYGYTEPLEGSYYSIPSSVTKAALTLVPEGANVVAHYHSHSYVPNWMGSPEVFSGMRYQHTSRFTIKYLNFILGAEGDIPFYIVHKYNGYLVTPQNKNLKFEYKTRNVTRIK
jgi:RHS repeat-associated protein